jgi:hypothetical protein
MSRPAGALDCEGGPSPFSFSARVLLPSQEADLSSSGMLANSPMTTPLPVVDLPRARSFAEAKLGPVPEGRAPDGTFVGLEKAAWFHDSEGNILWLP